MRLGTEKFSTTITPYIVACWVMEKGIYIKIQLLRRVGDILFHIFSSSPRKKKLDLGN